MCNIKFIDEFGNYLVYYIYIYYINEISAKLLEFYFKSGVVNRKRISVFSISISYGRGSSQVYLPPLPAPMSNQRWKIHPQ